MDSSSIAVTEGFNGNNNVDGEHAFEPSWGAPPNEASQGGEAVGAIMGAMGGMDSVGDGMMDSASRFHGGMQSDLCANSGMGDSMCCGSMGVGVGASMCGTMCGSMVGNMPGMAFGGMCGGMGASSSIESEHEQVQRQEINRTFHSDDFQAVSTGSPSIPQANVRFFPGSPSDVLTCPPTLHRSSAKCALSKKISSCHGTCRTSCTCG
jgi:hypothetical protein